MFGLPLGVVVETLVTILLATTIGYCVVLNSRLKRLHADRDQLRGMIGDLVQATSLANAAIQELKTTATEAEGGLQKRLDEAGSFGIELANHIVAGRQIMERIARITALARTEPIVVEPAPAPPPPPIELTKVQSALQQLALRPRIRGDAA